MSADFVLPDQSSPPARTRRSGRGKSAVVLLACTAAALPLVAACSSSPSHPSASVTDKTCEQISAVLSDGPDPGADKVGYAEAQILPLRAIRTSSPVLRSAISDLANAYDRFFASNGQSAAATSAVAAAAARMNKLCPGAGAAA